MSARLPVSVDGCVDIVIYSGNRRATVSRSLKCAIHPLVGGVDAAHGVMAVVNAAGFDQIVL